MGHLSQMFTIIVLKALIFALLSSCDGYFELKTSPIETEIRRECGEQCPNITKVFPLAAKPGEVLSLSGKNFTEGMSVEISAKEYPITVLSSTEATMITPEGGPQEIMMAAKLREYRGNDISFFRLALDYPLFTAEASKLCRGEKFYTAKGELTEGTKNCTIDSSDIKPESIIEGVKIAGVEGKLPLCASNGSQNCVATGNYYAAAVCGANGADACYLSPEKPYDAADLTNLRTDHVKRGITIAGITGNFPSSAAPLPRYSDSGGSTSTTGADVVDLTLFSTQLTTDAPFEFWDSNGQRYTGSGDSDIIASNVRGGISFENLSITGAIMAPPTGFQAHEGPLQVYLTWEDAGGSGYLLVFRQSAQVSFAPVAGTSYATGMQGSDEIIYVGVNRSITHEGLTAGLPYYYALYAYDVSNHYSLKATAVALAVADPCSSLGSGAWVSVQGDGDYGTYDFCVMKYEAKNVASSPESNAADTPWVSITQTNAISECDSLGATYDLISNPQWMTIAANLANVADNWSGASVGSGSLNRGHTDSTPLNALAADPDDQNACSGTGQTCNLTTWDIERRTHKLSSGEVMWDLGGNVDEWTNYYQPSGKATPVTYSWWEYPSVGDGATTTKNMLVPTQSVKSYWGDSWDSTQGIGQYLGGANGSAGSLYRGGAFYRGSLAGVFSADLNSPPAWSGTTVGLRCTSIP